MDRNAVKRHFDSHALAWLREAYQGDGRIYPTARNRVRIVSGLLADEEKPLRIADLGCGGGELAITLARLGHRVTGIDAAPKMIEIARAAVAALPPEAQDNVDFVEHGLDDSGLPEGTFDVVTAMGVIGYQESDEILFHVAAFLLGAGGRFILSCRNRLFNMASPSPYTVREIEDGDAVALLKEMEDYCQPVGDEDAAALIERLRKLPEILSALAERCAEAPTEPPPDDSWDRERCVEPRQHTPKGIETVAARFDFRQSALFGVHPHLIDPRANWLLPPDVFNALSDCLGTLEHLPVSLLWSSVFISVLEMRD